MTTDAPTVELLEAVRKCTWIYGVTNAVVVATVIGSAVLGGSPSAFMWVRALILLAVAPLLLWFVRRAARGNREALGRIRIMATVLPIAIIVVDLIPGVCPAWYAALQGIGAIALVPVAVIAWRVASHSSRPAGQTR
ncbi:hypothetical protein D7I44_09515 [Gryllotalpicola protaetiae]|uniref:Uncharacterized protein n=2 Tax=Gryllotalpicola protaetiae TaxID=2419771 RepID=A0A387BRY9_9MICO|nr:hypothetical protein D7I44_09515 [Gryllotalpicola protaetiae]